MSAQTGAIDISEIDAALSSLANEITRARTRVLIQESGTPVAALVSLADVRRLEQLDREWQEGTKALERFSQAFADVPAEELEAEKSLPSSPKSAASRHRSGTSTIRRMERNGGAWHAVHVGLLLTMITACCLGFLNRGHDMLLPYRKHARGSSIFIREGLQRNDDSRRTRSHIISRSLNVQRLTTRNDERYKST